ncbi:cation transporter [Phenylobacterium hankyongense]|uniref:Cation transporter n=1 Tax=Phenylobacterium hankyongense TaxID=1813876 RepID=A0A328B341_9CAUL|nr:CDF family Co(II)/Ni(II) efflux transporter DmeF [Phenylobacterium hankyongense]RAK60264.1 cation transporter [Phenylobacterium hankyongense]
MTSPQTSAVGHSHVFLGAAHEASERRTWAVIWLCGAMMIGEVVGGLAFGSIALVADGLHMSTHAGALLLAALAYTYSRKYAQDPRFSFGTGKLGDLAGFSSAIGLAMISLLIGYEALTRFLHPVAIHFGQAIPIAVLGLIVNLASAWLLSRGGHDHHHGHGHSHGSDEHDHAEEAHTVRASGGALVLSVFEDGVPPRFQLRRPAGALLLAKSIALETRRADGARQAFTFTDRGGYLESVEEIPEPHAFAARLRIDGEGDHEVVFEEHDHDHADHHRDNNLRAAVIHVAADAAVSVLVIIGLVLARVFGWVWMDPLAGLVGACVIASWSYGLIRDTGAILLDMNPDRRLADRMRRTVEACGDEVADLHLWRLGPGHLGAIVCVATSAPRDAAFYRQKLSAFPALSHLTIEIATPAS